MNLKMWKDMLTEKVGEDRLYSQGRVYLLWSVLAYYITLGVITVKALKPEMNITMEPLKVIIEALQWAMGLFAGYVFGTKGVDAVKTIFSKPPVVVNGQPAPANGQPEPEI